LPHELKADGHLQAEFDKLLRASSVANPMIVTRRTLQVALQRLLAGRVGAEELTAWANDIEGRDEVRYESGFEKLIATILFEIATPEINRPLAPAGVRELLGRLGL
jgi:hypothetical protein